MRREALLDRLQAGLGHPLSLICGPAGSGKSTVVAQWLENCGTANGWLSLDVEDSDLRTFVAYFIAAIREAVPDACAETSRCLNRIELPGPDLLADYLCNDVEAIGGSLILVLDDYHRVSDPAVHQLLDRFLGHSPPGFNLVIISRRDPPISVATMRARGQMTEIRIRDLLFQSSETAAVFEQTTGGEVDSKLANRLQDTTEGWAVIVHLAALALRGREGFDDLSAAFRAGSQEVQDYLMAEVLAPMAPDVRARLRQISVLDRMSPSLCAAVIGPDDSGGELEGNGEARAASGDSILRVVRDSGLPFVTLDQDGEWIRYHHLIQELLQRQLLAQQSEGEIADLHRRASAWFEEHELFEEAIGHELKGGRPGDAGQIIVRHRFELTGTEQWLRLIAWLKLLPEGAIDSDAELLIAYARTCDKRGLYLEWERSLDRAQALLEEGDPVRERRGELMAEIAMMQSILDCHAGDAASALRLASQALDDLPEQAVSERSYAHLIHALSLQMSGRRKQAYKLTYQALQDGGGANVTSYSRLLHTLCFLDWNEADLPNLARTSNTTMTFAEVNDLPETMTYARYYLGASLYQQNQLEAAESHLWPVAKDPHAPGFFLHVMAVQALALSRTVRGDPDGAVRLADRLLEHILNNGGTSLLPHAQALRAELALTQGRTAEASAIAREIEISDKPAGGYHFAIPELTVAKCLIRDGSVSSLAQAGDMLEKLGDYYRETHNRIHQILVLGLQALLEVTRGDEGVGKIAKAVALAQPGGIVRLFVDLGPEIAPLLNRIELNEDGMRYVGQILAAFRESPLSGEAKSDASATVADGDRQMFDALSSREHEILTLLVRRMSNKEIGAELFISPGTVKCHTNSIYSKLAVHGRREAVAKAQGLGLLK